MFPRVLEQTKNKKVYKYLIIQESVRKNGKIITNNVANLGALHKFREKEINSLINGLIKIFQKEEYTKTENINIIESLDFGNILIWKTFWQELSLTKLINKLCKLKHKKLALNVGLYTSIMVYNRCILPSSKLKVTRWFDSTSLKLDSDYKNIINEVDYYYRSMDYLIKEKDAIEEKIFQKLRTLLSINIKLTFYDITSTFFEGTNCKLGKKGYSRDQRQDRPQIVIGVVTTYEGFPIKHYVFEGNTQDSTTVSVKVNKKSTTWGHFF